MSAGVIHHAFFRQWRGRRKFWRISGMVRRRQRGRPWGQWEETARVSNWTSRWCISSGLKRCPALMAPRQAMVRCSRRRNWSLSPAVLPGRQLSHHLGDQGGEILIGQAGRHGPQQKSGAAKRFQFKAGGLQVRADVLRPRPRPPGPVPRSGGRAGSAGGRISGASRRAARRAPVHGRHAGR